MYKQDPEQVTVKFIVLGNQGVGKTSFLDCKIFIYIAISQSFGKTQYS